MPRFRVTLVTRSTRTVAVEDLPGSPEEVVRQITKNLANPDFFPHYFGPNSGVVIASSAIECVTVEQVPADTPIDATVRVADL